MRVKIGWVLALAAVLVPAAEGSIGLSTQFVNVVMENLKPGRTYNLRELKGVPYTVKNRGDGVVDVLVETTIPTEEEIRQPYEPVPDPSWVEVNPSQYRLAAGEGGFSDVIIRVPDDPKLVNRHFQAMVWAHTLGTGFMAAGVKSMVRFSIGKGPETLEEEARQKAMVDLNYDFWPTSLYVTSARPGPYDVKKAERKSFKLTNRSEKELSLVVSPAKWLGGEGTLPPGYERIADLSWVKFVPDTVTVEPESIKDIKVMLDVPERLKGKKLAMLVSLALPIGTVINMSTRLFVAVEGEAAKP